MKNRLLAVGALLSLMASMPVAAAIVTGFVGPFAPASFATTLTGNVNPAGPTNDGSVISSPTSVAITGGNDPANIGCTTGLLSCEIRFTHSTSGFGTFSFHWVYVSADDAGAQIDQFGLLVDGAHINLSDPGGFASQSGDATFKAINSFGWFINCGDCTSGAATATISAFVAAVPEPGSLALLGLGLAGLGALRRKL